MAQRDMRGMCGLGLRGRYGERRREIQYEKSVVVKEDYMKEIENTDRDISIYIYCRGLKSDAVAYSSGASIQIFEVQ